MHHLTHNLKDVLAKLLGVAEYNASFPQVVPARSVWRQLDAFDQLVCSAAKRKNIGFLEIKFCLEFSLIVAKQLF